MDKERLLLPGVFSIQWHLTERCNWRCSHCYQQEEPLEELSFDQLCYSFKQCLGLFRALRIPHRRAFFNIGGGEPFLRKDITRILEFVGKYKRFLAVHVMTNGSLITQESAALLRWMKVAGVQVSLEGNRETNDRIRGAGSFERITNAIMLLRRYSVPVFVSFTLHQENMAEIAALARYLKLIGANSFVVRRQVPMGRGKDLQNGLLAPRELKKCFETRKRLARELNEKGKFLVSFWCDDAIACSLTKQYYFCGVLGGNVIDIASNGDIMPCRKFPVKLGNILRDDLVDIYFSSDTLWRLRSLENAHPLCRRCPQFRYCKGGAKCLSLAYFGNPFAPDPQCFRLFKKLPPADRFPLKGHGNCLFTAQ